MSRIEEFGDQIEEDSNFIQPALILSGKRISEAGASNDGEKDDARYTKQNTITT